MRTDIAFKAIAVSAAGAAVALAAACSRPGAGDAGAAAPCDIPQGLAAPHSDAYCGLPADLRGFVSEHQAFQAFSGGEPADAAALDALARERDQRLSDHRARWSQLRARHAGDAAVSAWMQRYGDDDPNRLQDRP